MSKTRPHPRHNARAAISSPRFGCSTWIVLLCFTASTETSHWIATLYSVTDGTQYYPAFCKTASLNISPVHREEKPGQGWKREHCFLFIFAEPESVLFSPQTSTSAVVALVQNRSRVHRRSTVAVTRCRGLMQADYLGWSRLETGAILLVYASERRLWFIPLSWKFTLSINYSGARLCQDFVRGKMLTLWRCGTIPETSKTQNQQLAFARQISCKRE